MVKGGSGTVKKPADLPTLVESVMPDETLEQFGRYSLIRRLAFGGMAEIFLAAMKGDEGFEKRVVLKRILPQFSADPAFVSMFIDEAKVAARLSHPNIVQVYDFGAVDGVYFITMEFVDGADLHQILKWSSETRMPLPAPAVAAIGEDVARGLHYAHTLSDDRGAPLRIVHRDVSPHNIMLSRAGTTRLMDFGIAKAADRATRTATGTIKGKVAYMAPEQASDRELDGRADQFALGLVLWECLTGVRMFQSNSDLDLLRQVVECRVRPVTSLRPDVPEALDRVIRRSLAADPNERYPSLEPMARDLATFRFSLGEGGVVHLGDLAQRAVAPARVNRRTRPLPPGPAEGAASQPTVADRIPVQGGGTPPARPPSILKTVAQENMPASSTFTLKPQGRRWVLVSFVSICALAAGGMFRLVRERPAHTENSRIHAPSPRTAPVRVVSEPPGAAVFVDGRLTGLSTPAVLPRLRVGERLSLEVRHVGFAAWHTDFLVLQENSPLKASLVPLSPSVPLERQPLVAEPKTARPGGARIKALKKVEGVGRTTVRAAPPTGAARLWLRSSGAWVDVYLAGKKLGTTPLSGVPVPSGRVELQLVNAEAGIDRSWLVDLANGEEARRTVSP